MMLQTMIMMHCLIWSNEEEHHKLMAFLILAHQLPCWLMWKMLAVTPKVFNSLCHRTLEHNNLIQFKKVTLGSINEHIIIHFIFLQWAYNARTFLEVHVTPWSNSSTNPITSYLNMLSYKIACNLYSWGTRPLAV